MVSWIIKAVLKISTVITAMALFLKAYVLDFSLSRSPILWSSFLSWLKPPYLFVLVNVIIPIVVASSSYPDGEDDEILHGGDYEILTEQIVHRLPTRLEVTDVDFVDTFPPPIVVAEVERSLIVYKEKTEEEENISGVINGGDEFVVPPSMMEESKNLSLTEKPPVMAKPVKSSLKGGNKRKALQVAKPKTTMEKTWKKVTEEGKSTPFGVDAGEGQPAALKKSVSFRDVTNYQKSPTEAPPVKTKKVVPPSGEELSRRIEAFIKKCKEESRLESLRLDKEVA